MSTDREALAEEMARLRSELERVHDAYRDRVYEIEDLAYALYSRKAALDAAEHGIEPGVVVKLIKPMLWHGKMTPDLVVKIDAVEVSFRDDAKWMLYGRVKLKSGKWSERSTMIPGEWIELTGEREQ